MNNNSINLSQAITTSPTFIIYKQRCPYCIRAKELLPTARIYDSELYKALSDEIKQKYNHKTFPKVFIEGKFIGGCDDLEKFLEK
ncbi:hypothetical protein NUSPORA_02513 [Nucleospora cyclopteri]